jgi:hypothetical protein
MSKPNRPSWRPYLERLQAIGEAHRRAGKPTFDPFPDSYWQRRADERAKAAIAARDDAEAMSALGKQEAERDEPKPTGERQYERQCKR